MFSLILGVLLVASHEPPWATAVILAGALVVLIGPESVLAKSRTRRKVPRAAWGHPSDILHLNKSEWFRLVAFAGLGVALFLIGLLSPSGGA
ncbi:hypothetical protein [Lysobacter claricitrinus]|uniref:hypothetical protein n=1 Tax=Lysobacter claricitrinus TaxID=3367728 RepID=UPI0038B256A5